LKIGVVPVPIRRSQPALKLFGSLWSWAFRLNPRAFPPPKQKKRPRAWINRAGAEGVAMTTLSISASLTGCNSFPLEPTPTRPHVSPEAFWRKQLVLRRSVLEVQWHQAFPRHSFSDLRLIRSPSPDWAAEAWVWTAPEPPARPGSASKRADTRPRAAASTVNALAFQLRGGVDALRDPSTLRRLSDLSERQLRDLADHLGIWRWRRWSPDEIVVLVRIWGTNHFGENPL
jgi:hypothetical protein